MAKAALKDRTGGQVLVDQLIVHGVTRAFCVPGESYLEVLDAMHDTGDQIELVNARHEAGAANMAEAHGKLTGEPGICFVTRGPGACHASIGVHIARQDSTPMILFVGQIGREMRGREAFQEIDYRVMFGTVAKWVDEIDDAARIPEILSRAFRVATSGRPGPVVLALPEDMLTDVVKVADAKRYQPACAAPSGADLEALKDALASAERPMLVIGGRWSDAAAAQLTAFAEANHLPTVAVFRRQDTVANSSASYVGALGTSAGPKLKARMKEADLLVLLGTRLSEISNDSYTNPGLTGDQRIVHVYPEAEEIGRVYTPELGIVASVDRLAEELSKTSWGLGTDWMNWAAACRTEQEADMDPPAYEGALDLGAAMAILRRKLPNSAVVTLDAGNHTGWAQRFLAFERPGRLIGSTCGAMGYSVPAAVSAAMEDPSRPVISFVGDGGFMMSGQEIATSVQHGGCPIVLVFNNGTYGTIRMHQERDHPNRISGTALVNPDFAAMAEAMGAFGARVTTTDEFEPAFDAALASGKPAVIELVTTAEQISTRATITQMHARR
ncbi:thiamine pyrophosphate-dependent enzyme [Pseudoprimorskyibacter insulae]|uniref:Acetolactate synthase isozyme 2 large subunit n=1 Tax=Pseudoprimorskyibacter insulae TaxID=1695997 RepID=A0A2R8AVZ1_9RHOB|nr:thiamine pyrophosphate-dependent enzyme [Pseudoprimorskyibacter insulae]SPF80049.1 Acetolactate synthase isozyme 2 large subunit [Pseudoprimorskyibacter insulae]